MKISLKIKYSIFLGSLLLLTVTALSIAVLKGIKDNQESEYKNYLSRQAKVANIYVRQVHLNSPTKDHEGFLKENAQEIIMHLNSINGMHGAIYDMSGNQIVNNISYEDTENIKDILHYAVDGNIAYKTVGDNVIYMAPLYDSKQIGVVRFQYSLKTSNDFYNYIKSLFIRIGGVVFIFSFIVGYFYFNTYTDVILKLKKDTINIKKGIYNTVIPMKRNDELGELSDGIYYMSGQIKKNMEEMQGEDQKLRLAIKKLKSLENQQKVFIGNVTHEFKTPLTVIKAYVDLLDLYPEDINLLKDAKVNISKETGRLYDMVERILHLSSLEKYDFELQSEKINIKEILEEICSRMRGKARKFNITLESSLETAFILGDKESLMHIFINLVDNAIKYNESKGEIDIKNYIKEECVFIEISDTGIGIPEEAREKIFQPFYTVNKERAKEYGGTGLGLSLVKELVEKQKGTISLVQTNKKGSTFLISFPVLSDS